MLPLKIINKSVLMNKEIINVLSALGIKDKQLGCSTGTKWMGSGIILKTNSPVDGNNISDVVSTSIEDYEMTIETAENAFQIFRTIPSPKRGDLVRQFGDALRNQKENLKN